MKKKILYLIGILAISGMCTAERGYAAENAPAEEGNAPNNQAILENKKETTAKNLEKDRIKKELRLRRGGVGITNSALGQQKSARKRGRARSRMSTRGGLGIRQVRRSAR